MIAALTEVAEAYESGDPASHPGVTVRTLEVHDPPTFAAHEIKALREKTGLSHDGFAHLVANAPLTVKRWEQGRSKPSATARRLLEFIGDDPQGAARRVFVHRRVSRPRADANR